jgi:leucyl aminopeptidase
MTLSLNAAAPDMGALDTPLLVVALGSSPTLSADLAPVDAATHGGLGRALSRRDFRGGRDELLHLTGGERGVQRVLLVGMGTATDRASALRRAGALAGRQGNKLGVGKLAFFGGPLAATEVEAVGLGLIAGSWDFKELKSAGPAEDERATLSDATILAADATARDAGVRAARAIGEGHSLARRLGMLPGNICTPDYLADAAREIGKRHGMKVTVLGRAEMQQEKMGSFLCVAQGTTQEPKLIVVEHMKGPAGSKPIALVGKGLCFDSGGISIKPAQGMEWMKSDMGGAAAVIATMGVVAALKPAVNVAASTTALGL